MKCFLFESVNFYDESIFIQVQSKNLEIAMDYIKEYHCDYTFVEELTSKKPNWYVEMTVKI